MTYWINDYKSMKKITQLVSSLNAYEVKLVQKYYAMSPKIEHNLKIKLFEIALKNPAISDFEAAKLLGNRTSAAFSMLKTRLQEDIMKVLIVEGKDKIFTTKYFKARHKVHYLMLEMDILEDRNLKEQATEAILKAKKIAKKYELVNDLVVINDIIINGHLVRQGGPKMLKKIRKSGIEELKRADDLFWGTDYFKQMTMPNFNDANKKITRAERSKLTVEKLQLLSETSDLSRIKFFHLRSKYAYLIDSKLYEDAKNVGLEFISFISTNNVLNTSDNQGGGHMMVANCCLNSYQYKEAILYADKGVDFFYKDSANQINMLEKKFLSLFYSKEFAEAKILSDRIRQLKAVKPGTFLYAKWLYYHANIEFANADFKSTLKTLKRQSFLKSDKSGWRLGYRILELMSLIDLEQYDSIPFRLETFRKLLRTITKENVERPKLMLLLLNRLVKENFDFRLVSEKHKNELELLQKADGLYYWDAEGYEVTRFDEWWATKLTAKRVHPPQRTNSAE